MISDDVSDDPVGRPRDPRVAVAVVEAGTFYIILQYLYYIILQYLYYIIFRHSRSRRVIILYYALLH